MHQPQPAVDQRPHPDVGEGRRHPEQPVFPGIKGGKSGRAEQIPGVEVPSPAAGSLGMIYSGVFRENRGLQKITDSENSREAWRGNLPEGDPGRRGPKRKASRTRSLYVMLIIAGWLPYITYLVRTNLPGVSDDLTAAGVSPPPPR